MATKKPQPKTIHSARMQLIRPYVDFNYNLNKPLTKHAKAKIKKYHDEISQLITRPHHVYRTRDKARLEIAQAYGQHEARLSGLKVAFIPTDGKHKPRLKFNKKKRSLTVSTNHVTSTNLPFNIEELIDDAPAHVAAVLATNKKAKSFTIQAGKFEIPTGMGREFVLGEVEKYMKTYNSEDSNHYFGNWMHGLRAHEFNNQVDFDEYQREKQKAREEKLRESRNRRKRMARLKQKQLKRKK